MFGKSIVHARQDVGPRVGSALTNQEVSVFFQQFLSVAAAHFAVVPRLALQLLLGPEGHGAHEQRTQVIHGRRLVEVGHLGLGRPLGPRVGLRLDGIPKGLWCKLEQGRNNQLREDGFL